MSERTDITQLHTPVMPERCIELLRPALEREGAVVVDGTLGMGGHSEAILRAVPNVHLVGIDRDLDAIEIAGRRLAPFADRIDLVHAVNDAFDDVLDDLGIGEVDGVLLDLGVSSLQLDEPERGFSYARNAPLDMRMDQSSGETAAELLARLTEQELRDLFYRYGDEKLAPRYASRIVAERESSPITTTEELVDLLQRATPAAKRDQGHPAKRVFQALRVAVNRELDALEHVLPQAMDRLRVGGRIVVESYQSLEDRLVKHAFQERSTSSAPRDLPVELPEHRPQFALLTRGAERASDAETAINPRALPVRLRAAEKIRST